MKTHSRKAFFIVLLLTTFWIWASGSATAQQMDKQATANAPWKVGEIIFSDEKNNGLCSINGKKEPCYFERKFLGIDTNGYYLVQDFYSPETAKRILKSSKKIPRTDPYLINSQAATVMSQPYASAVGLKTIEGRIVVWYLAGHKSMEGEMKIFQKQGRWSGWYEEGGKHNQVTYVDGLPDGRAQVWYGNGQIKEESHYQAGQLKSYTIWYENGAKQEVGQNSIDKSSGKSYKSGLWTQWNPQGKKQSETNYVNQGEDYTLTQWGYRNEQMTQQDQYVKGKKHGKSLIWYENGQMAQDFNYKNGLQEGMQKQWFDNGQLNMQCVYANDKRNGQETWWYKNGQKWQQTTYVNGISHGAATVWSIGGTRISLKHYVSGQLEGPAQTWYDNGQLKEEGSYKDGKKVGVWQKWSEKGELVEETNF